MPEAEYHTYEIYFPAGHPDHMTNHPICTVNFYSSLQHYVDYYHATRKEAYMLPGGKTEGPLYVRITDR